MVERLGEQSLLCNHPVLSSHWSLRFTLIDASNRLGGAG